MLRLIGFVVVVFVAVVAYQPLSSLFHGTATMEGATQQVRTEVSEAIAPRSENSTEPAKLDARTPEVDDEARPGSVADASQDNTEAMARRLLQKATDQNSN